MKDEKRNYQEVVNYIKEGLRLGIFQTGGKLPTEREMAAELNMSRNSVREVLGTLDNMGILECRQGSGNYLKGNLSKGLAEVISVHIMMETLSLSKIIQTMRGLELESFNTIIATHKQDPVVISDMKELCEVIAQDNEHSFEAGWAFHSTFINMIDNPLFDCIVTAFKEAVGERLYNALNPEQRKVVVQCNLRLLEALEKEDREEGIRTVITQFHILEEAAVDLQHMKYDPEVLRRFVS